MVGVGQPGMGALGTELGPGYTTPGRFGEDKTKSVTNRHVE